MSCNKSLIELIDVSLQEKCPEIIEKLKEKRNNVELIEYAKIIPKPSVPESCLISGTIFMYVSLCLASKNVKAYLENVGHMLRPEIIKFFEENSSNIDKYLEEFDDLNYKNFDHIQSQKMVDYLMKTSKDDYTFETPLLFYFRQSIQFYYEDGFPKVIECFKTLLERKIIHATPTNNNSGKLNNQLSSCFILNIGDSLDEILDGMSKETGLISKEQGGIGMSLSNLRHSTINGAGESEGALSFASITDRVIETVNQGGMRPGAAQLTLRDAHIDIKAFIEARDKINDKGIKLKNATTCVYISDIFMRRVKNKEQWTCFCPKRAEMIINGKKIRLFDHYGRKFDEYYPIFEKRAKELDNEYKKLNDIINAKELVLGTASEERKEYIDLCKKRIQFKKQLINNITMDAFDLFNRIVMLNIRNSMPSICFSAPTNYKCNQTNMGNVESMNLCLEITEVATPNKIASCNLAHVNLKAFITKKSIIKESQSFYEIASAIRSQYDFPELEKACKILVRNLNKVIDHNKYPLDDNPKKKISTCNFEDRPLGIGVSGFTEILKAFGVSYESKVTEILNQMIFACMYYSCLEESCNLAIIEGPYPNFYSGSREYFLNGRWITLTGSPFSNGFLQFDLWKQYADYLESIGQLPKSYKRDDDIPLDPLVWGSHGDWNELKHRIKTVGIRNSMFLALMPTASSSSVFSNPESVEDHQSLVYSRKTNYGNFTVYSKSFVEDMQSLGIWNEKTYEFVVASKGSIKNLDQFVKDNYPGVSLDKVRHLQKVHRGMLEVSQKRSIEYQRQRGIYIDHSESHNHFFTGEPYDKVLAAFMYSFDQGVKTGSYYIRIASENIANSLTISPEAVEYAKQVCSLKNREACEMCQ